MRVTPVDEMAAEREAEFLVYIYEGGEPGYSWSVDSYLLADTDLQGVLQWLSENLPPDCCWSLGVVQRPKPSASDFGSWFGSTYTPPNPVEGRSEFDVAWIVGGDVLNFDPSMRSAEDERRAQAMLERRHSVAF